jgi:antitoxin PrlF
MPSSTIASKGQTTIPSEIRKYLHLEQGSRIDFVINDDGRVIIFPATRDVTELKGILPRPSKPISIAQMKKVIRQRGVKRCKV